MTVRARYEYERRFGHAYHTWVVVGAKGALHLHITDYGEHWEYGDRYSGGIEMHYRSPPDYMADDAPSHDDCWVLKAPCWHDGSSLQASEHWIPFWRMAPNDHDRMFAELEGALREKFQSAQELLVKATGVKEEP